MKFLFDLFPIILFFIAFKIKGIYVATGIAIAASICQIIYMLLRKRKIDTMVWVSLGILILFGGSTILLKNEMFIKWKPTILYWFFALAIIFTKLVMKKNIMKALFKVQINMPDKGWDILNLSWCTFFIVIGAINLFVAYHFTTNAWVNFKLFGVMGCIFLFVLAQSIFLAPYIEKD